MKAILISLLLIDDPFLKDFFSNDIIDVKNGRF